MLEFDILLFCAFFDEMGREKFQNNTEPNQKIVLGIFALNGDKSYLLSHQMALLCFLAVQRSGCGVVILPFKTPIHIFLLLWGNMSLISCAHSCVHWDGKL